MKKILLSLLILFSHASFSQDSSGYVIESQFEPDLHPSSQEVKGELDLSELVNELRKDREYEYMTSLDSLLRSRNRSNQSNASLPGRSIFNSPWFFYPAVAIVAFFVLFILYRILGSSGKFFWRKNKNIVSTEILEETAGFMLGDLFSEERAGNFRMATRLLFLQTLDALNRSQKIEFLPGRSNREYISRMAGPMKTDFKFLVLKYEYFWYGNHHPSKEQYELIKKDYEVFLNSYALP